MLTADHFPEFYEKVHGHPPFPWQRDLVVQVLADGEWPDLLDIPTGLGKTSTLDAAVFIAAATAGQGGSARVGRRRILFVVDRRIVVDEATEHARTIADALQAAADRDSGDSGDRVLTQVADAVRSYAPNAGGELLAVTRMRGGTTWEAAWLDRPDRPGIVIGTIDQVGSRLLFRGYGVSDRRAPIDAALVGTDALLLVDEAHLAEALTTTLAAAGERDRMGLSLPGLWTVRLTATPNAGNAARYPFDLDAHLADDEARRRLNAGKTLHLLQTSAKQAARTIADTAVRLVEDLTSNRAGGAAWPPAVLVVCNTVDRARAVHTLLAGRAETAAVDVDLLIGRSRPVDRAGLQQRILTRFGVGRSRAERPAILVATQTVEVGINIDADALVTESAAWDALVQRLGRLNRLGRLDERLPDQNAAPAVIVHDGQEDGPVYGPARDAAWAHLTALVPPTSSADALAGGRTGLPVSPRQCRVLAPGAGPDSLPSAALSARPDVPVLQTPTLDAWVCTGPRPTDDPPIESFLHGFGAGTPTVQVAWRDGLAKPADDSLADPFDDETAEIPVRAAAANALLTAIPVATAELADIPLYAVRAWMSGETPPPVADLDSAVPDESHARPRRDPFPVLAWRDDDTKARAGWTWVDATKLRAGDQIVVPATQGGLDEYGWSPDSTTRVRDAAEQAIFDRAASKAPGRQRLVLRVDAALPDRLALGEPHRTQLADAIRSLSVQADREDSGIQDTFVDALNSIPETVATEEANTPSPLGVDAAILRDWLAGTPKPRLTELTAPQSADVVSGEATDRPVTHLFTGGRLASDAADRQATTGNSDEDPMSSSVSAGQVTLRQHHARVRERAAEIAAALGFDPPLANVIATAAYWHDLGKVEDRFQAMLHGGDTYEALIAAEPLAKSGLPQNDRAAWTRARVRSGLPAGARHEAWSAALVEAYLAERPEFDLADHDLLVHLVAAHHGHARPLLPPVVDRDPRPIKAVVEGITVVVASQDTVSLDQPRRFATLNQRYGRWGLALLEAVVRAADTTVSAEGS